MRSFIVRNRRKLAVALTAIGLINATLILRPWARDAVAPTDIAAAVAAPVAPQDVGAQALISFGKAQIATAVDQRRIDDSMMFIAYFLLSTRAFGDQCEARGSSFETAKAAFASAHTSEYERASQFLAGHGINTEFIWAYFKTQLMELAAGHVTQFADLEGTDAASVCAKLASEPRFYTERRRFSVHHPELHGRLMQN